MKRPLKTEIRHRINAGRAAVMDQFSLFQSCFGAVSEEWKADGTRVTFADIAISEKLFGTLQETFSNDDYCSEESDDEAGAKALKAEFCWILDPIDGTNNFFFGMPTCAISLALMRNGFPVYGFLYDYSRNRLIEGGKGYDLLDGDKRASLKKNPFSDKSIVALNFPMPEQYSQKLLPMLGINSVRSIGSSALNLAWTAIGKIDGMFDFRCRVWDMAAGFALLESVGADVCFIAPSPFPLEHFDVSNAPSLAFYSGTPAFNRYAAKLFQS